MRGGALTAPPGREEIHHNLRNFSEGLQAPRRLVSDKSGRMNKFASLTSRVAMRPHQQRQRIADL